MEDIQCHPWFTVERHFDLTLLPKPPTSEEIRLLFKSSPLFDERILETLKVLWSDLSKTDIINALLNDE
jgi:hypothetical protein